MKLKPLPKEIPKESVEEYRYFFFKSDKAQSRVILSILTIAIAAFGFSDYALFGLSTNFLIITALRTIVVLFSLVIIYKIKKTENILFYDNLIFLYLISFIGFSLLVNSTRPQDFPVESVILGISVFAIYLAIPTRFRNQLILSVTYTVSQVLLLAITIQAQNRPEFMPIVFVFIFANAIAALASWEFNYYRWLVYKDLSELKKSERFVVIGQTAGMVGHDIRNPLQAITNDLFIIQQEINNNPNCSSEEVAESINSINSNISYVNKIISDLQDYTKNLTLNLSLINIKSLFEKALVNTPINVDKQVNIQGNIIIYTDAVYLQRILDNLVINAVQAMPNGGMLTLEAEMVQDKVRLRVRDTGLGIPENVKPNLFKPLFTTKAKGQGLGLAVVKRLVVALGGTITFESENGKGTTFLIDLPNRSDIRL